MSAGRFGITVADALRVPANALSCLTLGLLKSALQPRTGTDHGPRHPVRTLNDLEVRLLQAQDGTLTAAQFLDGLLTSTAFVLLDKAIGEDGAWDEASRRWC